MIVIFSYKNIFVVLFVGFLSLSGKQNLPGNPIGVQMWIRQTNMGLQKVGIIILSDPVQNDLWSSACTSCAYLDVIDSIVEQQNGLSLENKERNSNEIGSVSALFCDFAEDEKNKARVTEHFMALYKCKTYSLLFNQGPYIDSLKKFIEHFDVVLNDFQKILIVVDANVDGLDTAILILEKSVFVCESSSWSEFEQIVTLNLNMLSSSFVKYFSESDIENLLESMNIKRKKIIEKCLKFAKPLKKEYIHAFIDDLLTCCNYCGKRTKSRCNDCHLARYCSNYCRRTDFENHHQFCLEADPQV